MKGSSIHLKFLVSHLFNSWLSHGMRRSLYLYGHHRLIKSIVILCEKSCPCLLSYYIGLKKRDYALSLIICFIWGSKEVGDVVEARPQQFWSFGVLIGGLFLGLVALKRSRLAPCHCFFCDAQVEDSTHRFIQGFDLLSDLELRFSDLASLVTLLFDTKTS